MFPLNLRPETLVGSLCLLVFVGGAPAQEKLNPKHPVAADFGKKVGCPDGHLALKDLPSVRDSAAGDAASADAPSTRVTCGKCGFVYLPSEKPNGKNRWIKSCADPKAFTHGITSWASSLPKLQPRKGSLEFSQTVQGGNLILESVTYETTLSTGEIVPAIKNWLRGQGLDLERPHPPGPDKVGMAYAFSDRGISVQVFELLQQGARVNLAIEPHAWHPRASDFSQCPQGHRMLADVPIVFKYRRPYYYERIEEFHGEARELLEKDRAGEIVLGGDGSHEGKPSTRVVCKQCLFEFIPSHHRADLPGAWSKRDKDPQAFKHAFSDLLTSFPKLGIAKDSLKYTQIISAEGGKLKFEQATYETTLPAEEIVPIVKDWLGKAGFNPSQGNGPLMTRWPMVLDRVYYFDNHHVAVEIGEVKEDRGLQVIFEQKFEALSP